MAQSRFRPEIAMHHRELHDLITKIYSRHKKNLVPVVTVM